MTWGPTYGMWADTVEEMDEVIAHANKINKSLEQWKAYSKRLESALKDVAEKYGDVSEMYIDKAGAERAQTKLKEAALEEIQRLDPANKLLDPAYRKALYDKVKENLVKELRESPTRA